MGDDFVVAATRKRKRKANRQRKGGYRPEVSISPATRNVWLIHLLPSICPRWASSKPYAYVKSVSAMEILYRDPYVVAINKPSGLAVHRGWARDETYAMTELRDLLGAWVYPVHRLDRSASGVLLFGLSKEAARELCGRFERQEVQKRYTALVRGAPPAELLIDHPLRPDHSDEPQPAVTELHLLAQYGRYAWVEARPRTGRLHQIRRHLKHIACPIIGDVRYGKGEHNRLFRDAYGLHRLALHAAALTTTALGSGERLHLEAPLPQALVRVLESLASPSLTLAPA